MSLTAVFFRFPLNCVVEVCALGIVGRVNQRAESRAGVEYQVIYWYEGERRSAWFFEGELVSSTVSIGWTL